MRNRRKEENLDEAVDEQENDSQAEFKYSTHDPKVKWNRMKPQQAERYESPKQLKLCLTNHAISKRYQIRFKKCDSVRLHCVCASDSEKFGCPYYVKASWMSTEKSSHIKKIHPHHTCVKNFNNGKLMGPRWVVEIDGSFIKGQCKGQLLTAIGRDPNNQIFPIACAVVDIENMCNWKCFLQLLQVDLGMDAGRGMCVILDQHKGLLEATKEVLPYVEHTDTCEAVENGMTECFNAVILDARNKQLLTILEEIRLYMMDRFYNLRELAEKWEGSVCASAIKKMEEFGEDLKFWRVHPSGKNEFEVRNGLESYGVNIEKRSCACRLLGVSGIPCVHAQASIMLTHQAKTFISRWFDPKPKKKIGTPRLDPSLTQWRRRGRGGKRGNRGGGRVPIGGGGFHSQFERDVVSDGDGLDMADMDYIIEQITQLRKSGYTDVEIMRCLGIIKAHLEEFGYVLPMLKVDWKEMYKVMKKKKDMDKEMDWNEMEWKEVEIDKVMKKKEMERGMKKMEKEMEKKKIEKKNMEKKKMEKEMEKRMKWKELKLKMLKEMKNVEELKWKLKMFKEMKKVFR
uniref:SWIM-type domain-containing protein n=1 Tax=Lactuca sativa TaxID=4236 RepID=A0A9R1UX77_LACSA|nr:hypothetical protein LSAT_V11C800430660 [Lactuca sativa]